jgi:hypothetical protein
VVSLWEAMKEEERWAASAFDAMDIDILRNRDIELREAFKHFAESTLIDSRNKVFLALQ